MAQDKQLFVIEGNKIIAEFLNAPIDTKGADESAWVKRPDKELSRWTLLTDLKYHSSWDWLMPVVQKIMNKMPDSSLRTQLLNSFNGGLEIKAVWLAVVEFIKMVQSQK